MHELVKKYDYDVTNIKYVWSFYRRYREKEFENHGIVRCYTREV